MQWPLTGQSVPWANNPYLPPVITIGSLNLEADLNIRPHDFGLRLKFNAASIDCSYNGSGRSTDEVMRVIREFLDQIQSLYLELTLKENTSNLTMDVYSNIGAQIKNLINNLLTSGLKQFFSVLRQKVTDHLNQTKGALTKFQNDVCRKSLISEVNGIESRLNTLEKTINSTIDELRKVIDSAADTARDAVDTGADAARDAVDTGADAARDAVDSGADAARGLFK
ncbi:MAG TPA: hypothetical protein VHY08_19280 [Bacillota bacterium]|nr:hypothetical protein [Bacillota bacterium]